MIENDEILAKAEEFDIHPSNVQRDYVFGWLLAGTFQSPDLAPKLVLKGGNAFRKAFFATTRFSDDLDFSAQEQLDPRWLLESFQTVCEFAQARSGVEFDIPRSRIADTRLADGGRHFHKLNLYFRDFAGSADHITLKVRLDVVDYDRLVLPTSRRKLIHPYSDYAACSCELTTVSVEEALGDKLKCLLQRRHSHDLFDLVHGIFVSREVEVDRLAVAKVFLQKTIFGPSPATARNLLLGVPFEAMREFWDGLSCPRPSRLGFDRAVEMIREGLSELFSHFPFAPFAEAAFFPSELRNPIIEAGSSLQLLQFDYQGYPRVVEPYSLMFKRRRDGVGQEYFYGWDRRGGSSGPGIKAFLHRGIGNLEILGEKFEPRFDVELGKAGEPAKKPFFPAPPRRSRVSVVPRRSRSRSSSFKYIIQCSYCGKRFRRLTPSTRLDKHKDRYGNTCYGRVGHRV